MDPITIATIAGAISYGLGHLSLKVAEKVIAEPVAKEIKEHAGRGLKRSKDDKELQAAVKNAFGSIGLTADDDSFKRSVRQLGFDQLKAEDNDELRQEVARATLLLTEPDPALIPHTLYRQLKWPRDNRPMLALFLFTLRQSLEIHPDWGPLVKQANEAAVRDYLRQTSEDVGTIKSYLAAILADRDLTPDVDEATALENYISFIAEEYREISFLFIKPSGSRRELTTRAELEAVFVPLQVHDPDVIHKRLREGEEDVDLDKAELLEAAREEREEAPQMTISDVLTKHPVFLLRGKPGSGKTTLLRHLATTLVNDQAAERLDWGKEPLLPVLVPLRNFGRFLNDHRKEYTSPAPLSLRKFIEDYFREYELKLTSDFFSKRLAEGNCLVMLDGLDEVADRNLRATVAQIVKSFVKHYGKRGNRFILASRPKGYDEVARYLPRLVACDVQPMLPESRDALVYRLLGQFVANERRCRQEADDLLSDIRNKERVDELSRNPLFCTTLVLVYKYRGTTLPERRVDVYQELVTLMLGFWETHREGVSDVRELALMDGTGRDFMDENEAVEAKERALIDLADWMQEQGTAQVEKEPTLTHLADYFADREGADEKEKDNWAKGFLNVAHQRSGLFIEIDPGTYAFSHQNFREYLAATAVVNRTDKKMVQTVLANAEDSWWEEVILLAAAHEKLSPPRRELLLEEMLDAGHLLLAGRCAVDAGARLPAPWRRKIRDRLHGHMVDDTLLPLERYKAGETLDDLGWLPPDLNEWVRCSACADDKQDLWVMKYPVTNAQFALFIDAGGYDNPAYWGGEDGAGWQFRLKEMPGSQSDNTLPRPRYWQDARFGKERHGYPVVGVSWYEAVAFTDWLSNLLGQAQDGEMPEKPQERELIAGLLASNAHNVGLLSETEWVRVAGGEQGNRYPWDHKYEQVTKDENEILKRANTRESEIRGTSPVAMYPKGASDRFGLLDLAGNVWEWTGSRYDEDKDARVLTGGSWDDNQYRARVAFRYRYYPYYRNLHFGFRCASPSGSGS